MKQYAALIQTCESEIRQGNSHGASKRLKSLNPGEVPLEWRLPLAQICRRSGLYSLGLKLLFRLIHVETKKSVRPCTGAELAEYSILLLRSGVRQEALDRLNRIDTVEVPEARLYRAFCLFGRWEYPAAVAELECYLKASLSRWSS
jgi:hypothetical protein